MAFRPVLLAAVVSVLALSGPAVAGAQVGAGDQGQAPDPATDQYRESIPDGRAASQLPKRERRSLERSGPDGAAVVSAVEGPPAAGGSGSAPPAAGGSAGGGDQDPTGMVPTTPPADATTDRPDRVHEASIGPVPLWLAALVLALGGIATAVARWRRSA